MTLDDLWRIARRYWIVLLISLCVGLTLAAAYTWTRTPVYTATSQAFVGGESDNQGSAAYTTTTIAQTKAQAWSSASTSQTVLQDVIDKLNLKTTTQVLGGQVSYTSSTTTPSFTVSTNSTSPANAQAIANQVVKSTADWAQRTDPNTGVKINLISSATLPTTPSSPKPNLILPIGALLGLLGGFVLAMIRHRQDTRIRTVDDVERNINSSVLGVIPANRSLAQTDRALGTEGTDFHTRESLRQLRTNLRFVDVDHDPRSIVVTSARMGEGKSTVSSSLAWVLADSGDEVVLIDADLRRPAIAGIMDLDSSVGLTQVLAGTASLADALQPTNKAGLYVLTAGQIPPNPSELLGSQRMHELIEKLTETHRVILDAPPLLPVTDAALLSASADGAVIIIAAGETREEHIKRAAGNIERVGGRLLGTVLNRVNTKRLNRIVYGESQYGYGAYGTYGSTYYGESSSKDSRRKRSGTTAEAGAHASSSVETSPANADAPLADELGYSEVSRAERRRDMSSR